MKVKHLMSSSINVAHSHELATARYYVAALLHHALVKTGKIKYNARDEKPR